MELIEGKGRKRPKPNLKMVEYKRLLAKVHIARRELKITLEEYLNILGRSFGVGSAACLSNNELERLVDLFIGMGWRPRSPVLGNLEDSSRGRELIESWQERVR